MHLGIALVAVVALFGAGYWAVTYEHHRAHPVVAKESALEDLDNLLDTGLPTWRVHQDGPKTWTWCEDQDCPKPHQQYRPFHATPWRVRLHNWWVSPKMYRRRAEWRAIVTFSPLPGDPDF